MQYGMVIDLKGCIGCQTCAAACKVANNMPIGVWRNRVLTEGGSTMDTPSGEFPHNKMDFRPTACQHCASPACVAVCPAGAATKDPETGIVLQDSSVCIGCKSCLAACPYGGVRTYLENDPVYHVDVRLGYAEAPEHLVGTVDKCTFCYTRISSGEQPACMELCPGRARFYGDIDDPESEVSKMIAQRDFEQLKTEEGTIPSTFYLL